MAEKRTIELEIQDNSKSLKAQYKEAVAELQKVSAQYGETSEQAVKAARAAAELKDQIEFSKDLVDSFNPDAKFNALSRSVGGVLDGFQAFEGALGLIGVESEDLQKTMVRLQSVMALSQGLQGLMEAKDSFKQLGTVAANALKGIKTGIAATGIGLFLIAVGTIAAYWDDIKEAVNGVSEEQAKLNKLTDANLKASEAKLDTLNKQDNILRLQGKTEKQILQLKVAALDTTIKAAELSVSNAKATKKAQLEAEKRNYVILRGILEFLSFPLAALLRTVDEIAAFWGKDLGLSDMIFGNLTELVFNPSEVAEEGDAAIKAAEDKLIELRNTQAGYKIQINQIEKEAQDERNRINSQGNQNNTNSNKDAAKEQLDITRQMEEEKNRLMEEGRAKELDTLRIKYKYEQEEADKNFKEGKLKKADYDKLTTQMTESKRSDEKAVNDKYDKIERDERDKKLQEQIKAEDAAWLELQKARNSQREQELLDLQLAFDEKIAAANGNAIIEKAITDKFNKEYAAINEKYRKEEEAKKKEEFQKDIARKNELRQKTLELTAQSFSALADLAGSFNTKNEKDARKQFQVQKAFNLAAAITNTAMAVTGALTAGGNPIKLATGMQFVEAGIAATVGAANIIKISNSKFGGGGSGGGGNDTNVPTGAAPMTANFNTIGSSGINQLAQLQQTPTQAYVVSGEVTSAQALDRNRVQNATL
jgi:hypothetical protein